MAVNYRWGWYEASDAAYQMQVVIVHWEVYVDLYLFIFLPADVNIQWFFFLFTQPVMDDVTM